MRRSLLTGTAAPGFTTIQHLAGVSTYPMWRSPAGPTEIAPDGTGPTGSNSLRGASWWPTSRVGEFHDNGGNIFFTTDGGRTFRTVKPNTSNNAIYDTAINPATGHMIAAIVGTGVVSSTDGGFTWSAVAAYTAPSNTSSVAAPPSGDSIVCCAYNPVRDVFVLTSLSGWVYETSGNRTGNPTLRPLGGVTTYRKLPGLGTGVVVAGGYPNVLSLQNGDLFFLYGNPSNTQTAAPLVAYSTDGGVTLTAGPSPNAALGQNVGMPEVFELGGTPYVGFVGAFVDSVQVWWNQSTRTWTNGLATNTGRAFSTIQKFIPLNAATGLWIVAGSLAGSSTDTVNGTSSRKRVAYTSTPDVFSSWQSHTPQQSHPAVGSGGHFLGTFPLAA